jgi:hypothetical protein
MNGLHTGAEDPADNLPVKKVKDRREIHPTGGGTQVSYGVPLVR